MHERPDPSNDPPAPPPDTGPDERPPATSSPLDMPELDRIIETPVDDE